MRASRSVGAAYDLLESNNPSGRYRITPMASRRCIAEYDTSPPARRRAPDGLQALDMAQARWRRHNGADQAGLGTVARQQEPGGVRNDVDPEGEQPQPCPTRRAALDTKGADPSSARSRHHNSAPLVT